MAQRRRKMVSGQRRQVRDPRLVLNHMQETKEFGAWQSQLTNGQTAWNRWGAPSPRVRTASPVDV